MTLSKSLPLVVDLDGTLTPTDTLLESLLQIIRKSPVSWLRLIFWLLKGRAYFKERVSSQAHIGAKYLPYCEPLLDYLRSEREKGRRIILATAAHRSIADGVAAHLGLFSDVLATEDGRNLKGKNKLGAILEIVGTEFVYAGDSRADLPIWKAAKGAILVGVSAGLASDVRGVVLIEQEFPREKAGFFTWLSALRVHQWVKNVLLFVPLLTSYSFMEMEKLATLVIGFFAFSFAASATYIFNDLCDLESDRVHPNKRLRPFASGSIPILNGLAVAACILVAAVVVAFILSKPFFLALLLYIFLTTSYSLKLKKYVLMDVLMLSVLYTLRIVAGGMAINTPISTWLLAFSAFMFLSLALMKRCSELVLLKKSGNERVNGRDYQVSDLSVLYPFGLGSTLAAIVVFTLFINAPDTQMQYSTPALLWLTAIGLTYWLGRLWLKTGRGEMHDDPVIYAVKNRGSRITLIAIIATALLSRLLAIEELL